MGSVSYRPDPHAAQAIGRCRSSDAKAGWPTETWPREQCRARCAHYVHKLCADEEREAARCRGEAPFGPCPRCSAVVAKLQIGAYDADGGDDDGAGGSLVIRKDVLDGNGASLGGFRLSSKLVALRELLRSLPVDEKVIVFSFFKTFLDFTEAMLGENGRCFRFDGDASHEQNMRALEDFKKADAAGGRISLLATVHSGGVGLNIVEASTVIFCDRWLNPTVHSQAIDRTHRIGQTRTVRIFYIDALDTFDEWAKECMELRERTARMILKDGTQIGVQGSSVADALKSLGEHVNDAREKHHQAQRQGRTHRPRPTALPAAAADPPPTAASTSGAAGPSALAPPLTHNEDSDTEDEDDPSPPQPQQPQPEPMEEEEPRSCKREAPGAAPSPKAARCEPSTASAAIAAAAPVVIDLNKAARRESDAALSEALASGDATELAAAISKAEDQGCMSLNLLELARKQLR